MALTPAASRPHRFTGAAPFCSILPPHLLRNIARSGSPEQREAALRGLAVDSTLRYRRHELMAAAGGRPPASTLSDQPQRTIYDSGHQQADPPTGKLVRSEGGANTGDAAADEAYDGLGATFALYLEAYDRHSIDDEGLPLNAYVHFGQGYDNAFWDGKEMVFGDGDGQLFQRFTISVDVIGHELTHGVTQDEAGLTYSHQSGALNESISDCFGSLVKQHALGQKADEADWLIGEGLFTPQVNGRALRDMLNPGTAYDDKVLGKDPQPANMKDYVMTAEDNGGVHTNSGIPNRAFALAAKAIGGYAWEGAGNIWYAALRDPAVKPGTRFRSFALVTVRQARTLMGDAAAVAVRQAWSEVGVLS